MGRFSLDLSEFQPQRPLKVWINQRLVDMLWGRRTERRIHDPNQQELDFGGLLDQEQQEVLMAQLQADQSLDEHLVEEDKKGRRQRKADQRQTREFPEHLERRERILDLTDEQKADLKRIGESITERMRFEKPTVYIERIIRPKYVAKGQPERGVIAEPPPLSIVEGCKYDFSVIAAILSQKFGFHCPTYRQQDWFAQSGWHPSRSTINKLINTSVGVLNPLFQQMWHLLLGQSILMTDDTRVLLLTRDALSQEQLESLQSRRKSDTPPGNRSKKKGGDRGSVNSYAWVYTGLRDLAPYNVFHWSLGHQHAVVHAHLENYQGIVVGDGYGAYTQIEKQTSGRILHASCNTHARREFVKAEAGEPILSAQAESMYSQLYDVEELGKTLDPQGIFELRQRDAVPIWSRFDKWLKSDRVQRVLPQSDFGKAIGYLRNQWASLQRYLSDAYIRASSIAENPRSPLFRSAVGKSGDITRNPMTRQDVLRMVKRRSLAAGLSGRVTCHTFRATGITAYLENGGTIENAQAIAAHESPRTTKLYDRTSDAITLDEIERIRI